MEPQTSILWLIRAVASENVDQRIFAGNAVEDWVERYSDDEIDLLVRLLAYALLQERDAGAREALLNGLFVIVSRHEIDRRLVGRLIDLRERRLTPAESEFLEYIVADD
jgi:hypothetical protein